MGAGTPNVGYGRRTWRYRGNRLMPAGTLSWRSLQRCAPLERRNWAAGPSERRRNGMPGTNWHPVHQRRTNRRGGENRRIRIWCCRYRLALRNLGYRGITGSGTAHLDGHFAGKSRSIAFAGQDGRTGRNRRRQGSAARATHVLATDSASTLGCAGHHDPGIGPSVTVTQASPPGIPNRAQPSPGSPRTSPTSP